MFTPTPCVGICTTTQGDRICKGCGRYDVEVFKWNTYSQIQKSKIEARLVSSLTYAFNEHLKITKTQKLNHVIGQLPVRFNHRPIECQAYYVLCNVYAARLSQIGLATLNGEAMSTREAKELINETWQKWLNSKYFNEENDNVIKN